MSALVASIVFILGYALIALESKIRVNKSAWALAMGGILWVILGLADSAAAHNEIVHVAYDIFNIVVFLLAAMSLVEILVHYRVFDVIREKIFAYHPTDSQQFVVLTGLAFFFSALIDNLTTTIVMLVMAQKFVRGRNLLIAAVGIVIAANAGGAFSPIGDVTTIMLWLAGKFEATDILLQGFIPSLVLYTVMLLMMRPMIVESGFDKAPTQKVTPLVASEKVVIGLVAVSFVLPVLVKMIGLPPVMGLLLGLGITWIAIDAMKVLVPDEKTHMTASIESLIQKTDIASIKFFIGILLAVSALGILGVLDHVSSFIYGADQSMMHVIIGNTVLGAVSSFLDNIPLTAIAIEILDVESTGLWVLLALSVGTGGSLLSLGSAAGVVAMGMIKELTFEKYFKIGFVPALVSFLACIAAWGVQAFVFGLV